MEFFVRLSIDQVNNILKGLETLRDQSGNLHQYMVQQVQAQAAARSAPPAPAEVPAPPASPPATDEGQPQEQAAA